MLLKRDVRKNFEKMAVKYSKSELIFDIFHNPCNENFKVMPSYAEIYK